MRAPHQQKRARQEDLKVKKKIHGRKGKERPAKAMEEEERPERHLRRHWREIDPMGMYKVHLQRAGATRGTDINTHTKVRTYKATTYEAQIRRHVQHYYCRIPKEAGESASISGKARNTKEMNGAETR